MVATSTLIVTAIPLLYLAFALGLRLWSRGEADQESTEEYVAGNRGIGLLVLYFIMGASVAVLFTFFAASPLQLYAGLWGLLATTVVFIPVSLVTEVDDIDFARELIRLSRPESVRSACEPPSSVAADGGTNPNTSSDKGDQR